MISSSPYFILLSYAFFRLPFLVCIPGLRPHRPAFLRPGRSNAIRGPAAAAAPKGVSAFTFQKIIEINTFVSSITRNLVPPLLPFGSPT